MAKESPVKSKRRSPNSKLRNNSAVNAPTSDIDSTDGHSVFGSTSLERNRKRFVGVRQRPSGRWVAEIKDTIQKIRLWLGTYDTAEDAARAYDEAACMLRGKNTRTNFWPSPSPEAHGTSALPSRTARRLLLRLKDVNARNSTASTMIANDCSSEQNGLCDKFLEAEIEAEEDFKRSEQFLSSPSGEPNYSIGKDEFLGTSNSMVETQLHSNGDFLDRSPESITAVTDKGSPYFTSSSVFVNSYQPTPRTLKSVDTDMNFSVNGVHSCLDLAGVDELASGYSPFTIAAGLENQNYKNMAYNFMEGESYDCVEAMSEEENSSLFREYVKRNMYERKISASLYAMSGISDYFQYARDFAESPNLVGDFRCGGGDEIFVRPSEMVSPELSSPSSSSFCDGEQDSLEMLWNSLELPPICIVN
ncbi:hypothetical protein SUGI_0206560 [Cryptomeria japonica]|uniref:ethylene-responsive transcription factor ERN1-like n=1 Tax=Cryptomeria japonica TaxID=3369 RepID=UPI002408E411|nr:ethylene-responsive transcription factor ERN1-like [Cryptomeria japonica]GLJ13162.1 hypothetical protein SUGI_0206560 [Cryptomeria japonica]